MNLKNWLDKPYGDPAPEKSPKIVSCFRQYKKKSTKIVWAYRKLKLRVIADVSKISNCSLFSILQENEDQNQSVDDLERCLVLVNLVKNISSIGV